MKYTVPTFNEIFSLESLFQSFKKFERGKKFKSDVAEFKTQLISNLSSLHFDIMGGNYRHGGYFHFKVSDPKPRDIHKASVRDRVVHHAIYRALYPYFDSKFIFDSYSCRLGKGTHRAVVQFEKMVRAESFNYTKTLWVLKCDISKCFASVHKEILKKLLEQQILCPDTMHVINSVIDSFNFGLPNKGIPLGNLTSQLFINIYMNIFDNYVKRGLKVRRYIRYTDDFVIFSRYKKDVGGLLLQMEDFLKKELDLEVHPDKVFIKTIASGVDFLGWVQFPNYRVIRVKTKKRMFKNLNLTHSSARVASYLGLLKHGNAYQVRENIKSLVLEWEDEF